MSGVRISEFIENRLEEFILIKFKMTINRGY